MPLAVFVLLANVEQGGGAVARETLAYVFDAHLRHVASRLFHQLFEGLGHAVLFQLRRVRSTSSAARSSAINRSARAACTIAMTLAESTMTSVATDQYKWERISAPPRRTNIAL